MPTGPLTANQEKYFDWIVGYLNDNEYAPSRLDIAKHFNITRQQADSIVRVLVHKGYLKLTKTKGEFRNIRLIK